MIKNDTQAEQLAMPVTREDLAAALLMLDATRGGWADQLWAILQKGRPKRPMRLSLYKDAGGAHRWRCVAPNGEKMQASEGYTRKHDARRGATTIMRAPMVLEDES